MKYGLIVLMAMVSLKLVYGAESLEREEPAHPADAVAIATYANSIIEEGDFFGVHSDVQVRALETFTDSVVFKDDTRTEIIRIKLKGSLDRTGVTQLWQMLSYILEHPEQVGFRWARTSGLLEVDKLDIAPLDGSDPQFKILMLALANLKELTVHIRSDHALEQLIYVLRQCGNLEQLTILDINNRSLFERLSVVFRQHINLKRLNLTAKVIIQDDDKPEEQSGIWGRQEYKYFRGLELVFSEKLVQMFTLLRELEMLTLSNITADKNILKVFSNMPSLRQLEIGDPSLEDILVGSIFELGKSQPSLEKIKILSVKSYEKIRETVRDHRGLPGKPGERIVTMMPVKYGGKTYYPKQDRLE
jgi:hypothetical protein